MTKDKPEGCMPHQALVFKTDLNMKLLGANLFGVMMIACMVAWALAKGMPAMETRLVEKINTLSDRVAKLESWRQTVELNEIAISRGKR